MQRLKKISYLLVILLIIGLITGCENNISTKENTVPIDNSFISMEDEALITYEVPKSLPHIVVDQLGYLPNENKLVFFYGDMIPENFKVIDVSNNNTVYTGEVIDRGYNEEYKSNIGIGDFTIINAEGEYEIEAPLLGKSYRFSVKNDLYKEIFNEVCRIYYYNRCGTTITENLAGKNAHNACHTGYSVLRDDMTVHKEVQGGWHQDGTGSQNIIAASNVLANIMISYELYPKAFTDDTNIPESGNEIPDILDEIRYEVEWFLKMQDDTSGAVYSGITVNDTNNKVVSYVENPTIDSTYAFSMALAKFSYIYQKYDKKFATICLQAADRAWKYASLNEKDTDSESEYKLPAAAEIYRASGLKDCKDFLDKYFDEEFTNDVSGIKYYGWFTYLNTTQKVDVDVCEKLIGIIMKQSEEISTLSRESAFLVPCDLEQLNNTDLLDKMMNMILVDYVITNHEYDTIIENYLHYFLGRNLLSVSYIDNTGTNNYININESMGIMKQFENNSKLLFLLSKVNS